MIILVVIWTVAHFHLIFGPIFFVIIKALMPGAPMMNPNDSYSAPMRLTIVFFS